MVNKSSKERQELHEAIWKIAEDLRGSVDGWDFKQYVLGLIFYRYISENFKNFVNKNEGEGFDYANLSDDIITDSIREGLIKTKGFFILPSNLFENVVKNAKNDENLNETLKTVFENIEKSTFGQESEDDFKGLFDDIDLNSNKLGSTVRKRNELLTSLLNNIASIDFGEYEDVDIDPFGDAYEYLMGMYASNAGKSGGEYYTPQEVSELLARITLVGRKEIKSVYDPACGSGSLLLKFSKLINSENVTFFGQEINLTTYNLCRMNMFLHNVNFDKFDIKNNDTLIHPEHMHIKDTKERGFEAIVSNPPYSIKWEGDNNKLLINDERFRSAGVLAPKSKADLAFVMHSLYHLSTNGTAAIICFPGVMYRDGAEKKIRQYLVENNFIDAIIQLPSNLFYGTSISTCILVIKKSKENDHRILFIDASKEFQKVINNNKLTKENIQKIIDVYEKREEKEHFSKLVTIEEVAEQDYNLSVNSYVEQEDTREKVDIKELNDEIKLIVERAKILRESIDKIILNIGG